MDWAVPSFSCAQYCEGGDLSRKIKNQKKLKVPFPEELVLDWFTQLTTAIAYCHSKRVLHRDLKPGNVFLTATNQVKLGDFGIARVLENTMDKAQTVAGTPYFMSPEVCENKPYGSESDIWALGCILYEMCTLRHPFEATNLLGLVFKIVTEEPKPIPSAYSPSLWELVQRMLCKVPGERPSAQQVLEHPLCKQAAERLATSGGTTHEASQAPAAAASGQGGAGHLPDAIGITDADSNLTPQQRRLRRKQAEADRQAAMLSAATVARASEDAAAAAANRAKNTSTSHFGGQARHAHSARGDAQPQAAKTPRRGTHRVVHTSSVGQPPSTAPAAATGGGFSPVADTSARQGSSRGSARSSASSRAHDSRPIVSTGQYNLDGIPAAHEAPGSAPSGSTLPSTRPGRSNSGANTPGAHRRKTSNQSDAHAQGAAFSSDPTSHSSGSAPAHTPGFGRSDESGQPTGTAGVVAVKRTPRVRSRGSSRPVSADGMMMFQMDSGARASPPDAGRRAKSSMAKVHSAHHMSTAARPTATFALHDEDSDDEERFVQVAKGDGVYTDAHPSHSSRARSAASHFPSQGRDSVPAPVEHTVDDDYASDDFEEDSEALQMAVPEYQATVMVARNAERSQMQQYFKDATAQSQAGAARSVPGSTSGSQASAGASLSLDPGIASAAGGGADQPALQVDVRRLVQAERSKQAASISHTLGKGLYDKAVSFWKDAYTKGGGASELAKPDVAEKVKRTIIGLCANDRQKVAAFYKVEELAWSMLPPKAA